MKLDLNGSKRHIFLKKKSKRWASHYPPITGFYHSLLRKSRNPCRQVPCKQEKQGIPKTMGGYRQRYGLLSSLCFIFNIFGNGKNIQTLKILKKILKWLKRLKRFKRHKRLKRFKRLKRLKRLIRLKRFKRLKRQKD